MDLTSFSIISKVKLTLHITTLLSFSLNHKSFEISVMQSAKIQTAGPFLKKCLRSTSPGRYSGQSCYLQPDCCGKLPKKPKRNPQEPFVERDCFPDIYSIWKPKIPKLTKQKINPTQNDLTSSQTKHCYAGMKTDKVKLSYDDLKKKRKECLMNAPDAKDDKSKTPEVIIVSPGCLMSQAKHIFVTNFANNILYSSQKN